jgi:hypothetical protein
MFYKIKSKAIGWFGNVQVFKYPFFMLFGHTAYKIKGTDQREILNVIKPGDVLLRRYDHYLSGLMIPGYFTHAAIYVGDNEVIHLLGSGICKEDILTFLRCDNIMLLRFKNEPVVNEAITAAYEQLDKGVEYDYDFDTDKPDKFYCTEFVDFCFGYPVKLTIDHDHILPDDFMGSLAFSIVWTKGGN